MGDRGEKRRAQAVGLGSAFGMIQVLHEVDPLNRKRRLVDQRVEQTALIRRKQGPGLVAVDANYTDGATARVHGEKETLRAGKRVRTAPSRTIVLPGPVGGGKIGLIQHVLWGIASFDDDGSVLGQQQHHSNL